MIEKGPDAWIDRPLWLFIQHGRFVSQVHPLSDIHGLFETADFNFDEISRQM